MNLPGKGFVTGTLSPLFLPSPYGKGEGSVIEKSDLTYR